MKTNKRGTLDNRLFRILKTDVSLEVPDWNTLYNANRTFQCMVGDIGNKVGNKVLIV